MEPKQEWNPKTVAKFELALLCIAVALFLWWTYPKSAAEQQEPLLAVGTSTMQAKSFPRVDILARAAYVYDAKEKKVIFAKDAETPLPLASLTKLMSALTASSVVPDYMLVKITPADIREEGDTGLFPDEEWNIRKLIDYSLIVSSNDGIRAIATVAGTEMATSTATTTPPEEIFVGKMNDLARKLGLSSMRFMNQSGLDVSSTVSGGYGSAKDVAMLVDYILKNNPHLVEATSLEKTTISSTIKDHLAENTNKAIPAIPDLIASKTGYTDLSGGNVVVAWNAGLDHPVIISVMGSTYDGRFNDLDDLVKATLEYFSTKQNTVAEAK